jgi:hypothetical protein
MDSVLSLFIPQHVLLYLQHPGYKLLRTTVWLTTQYPNVHLSYLRVMKPCLPMCFCFRAVLEGSYRRSLQLKLKMASGSLHLTVQSVHQTDTVNSYNYWHTRKCLSQPELFRASLYGAQCPEVTCRRRAHLPLRLDPGNFQTDCTSMKPLQAPLYLSLLIFCHGYRHMINVIPQTEAKPAPLRPTVS